MTEYVEIQGARYALDPCEKCGTKLVRSRKLGICPECGNAHFPRNYEYILRRAVAEWGTESQLRQLQEECCELATAVSHLTRGREGAEAELIAEVADVEIMIEQARLMLGDTEIDRVKRSKIFRLAQKLNIDLTILGGV